MDGHIKNNYLFSSVTKIRGVGSKLSKYLKNKKIEKINDILWDFPYSYTDRSKFVSLDKLEIGRILTIKVKVIKYNFPRIRNLPNKIKCIDDKGEIDLVFFNSREGYIRKILPLNNWVIVSGKINFFRNKYQITNPEYVTEISKIDTVRKKIPKYSLTEGLTEKSYRKIVDEVINNLPDLNEWYDKDFLKTMGFVSWKKSIISLHDANKNLDKESNYFRRLVYDEIFAHLLVLSKNRKKIKKNKKDKKVFNRILSKKIREKILFNLTNDQEKTLLDIEKDLKSNNRMFRIVQGDVGSGKTIVSILSAANVIESGYQCALMAPTEILAKQHYNLIREMFKETKININLLSGKTDYQSKKKILKNLEDKQIHFLIGTHALFQKKIKFKKLGLIIIDEQHKFGVKQRINLAKKGGLNCDVLLMSATPIPRTMMLSIYGDMDVSQIKQKPKNRKDIVTLSKPQEKISEIWPYIEKQIKKNNQVFWVCPLIENSNILNYSSALSQFETINKRFPGKVGLIHGSLNKDEKDIVLSQFLNKKIKILVSTTVIEVGIDFPNANLIIIENSNKFGLAQLHQLRGRVGRGQKQGVCILLFKGSLSAKAIKRIKILKHSNDGFYIAEEDMKLRGFGDIIGFQQSGVKYFKLADPIQHADLFKIAETHIRYIEKKNINFSKFDFLIKLFDKAEVVSEI